MLIHNLMKKIEHNGFQTIAVNIKGINLYFSASNHNVYVTCLFDYSEGTEFTKEQYQNIMKQIRQNFINKGYSQVHLLGLILTKYPGSGKELAHGEENHWLIDESVGRLIIYEDQPGQFLNVREIVESCLSESKTMESESTNDYTDRMKQDNGPSFNHVPYSNKIKWFSLCNSIVIIINVLIFIIMGLTGSTEDNGYMVSWGAMYWPDVIHMNHYYRLFTHMFLHFDIQHLLNNMIVLAILGDNLERLVGKVRYIFIYLLSGILAGIASMVYNMVQNTIAISAGASGAIFGVVGAMVYIVAVNRGRVENISTRQLGFFVILSFYSGFTSQGVDNMAHVGGFIAGLIIAMIVYKRPKRTEFYGEYS